MSGRIASAVVVVLLCFLTLQFLYYCATLIRYPYEWDHTEGMVLFYAKQVYEGNPLYKDVTTYPMVATIYPPVYPFAASLVMHLCGVSLCAGRLLSFIAACLVAFLIYAAIRQQTGDRFLAYCGMLLFCAHNRLDWWLPLFRVDTLMLLLSLFGVFIIGYSGRPTRRRLYCSLIVLVAAFYTKQTALYAALAAFLYLVYANRRYAIEFALSFVAAVAALFCIINGATGGAFYTNIIGFNAHGFDLKFFLDVYNQFMMITIVLLAGSFLRLSCAVRERSMTVWDFYFIAAFLSSLSIGSPGAGTNHFLPLFSAACISCSQWLFYAQKKLSGRFIPLEKQESLTSGDTQCGLRQRLSYYMKPFLSLTGFTPSTARVVVSCLVTAQLLLFVTPTTTLLPRLRLPRVARELAIGRHLDAYIRNLDGEILIDTNINLAIKNGKQVHFFGPPYWLVMDRAGIFIDLSALRKDIEAKRFRSIVISGYFVPSALMEIIEDHYRVATKMPIEAYEGVLLYRIYEPKDS
ncbi:MAG: glycosyltransferase family 39 protein [Candidatus Omnitrophica bacterium]|nr:glycosyltransferase family 39 protein [Candidatus Omnitrophota bacterium]